MTAKTHPTGRAMGNGDLAPLDRSCLITPLALCSADTAGKETQGMAQWAGDNSQVGFSEPLFAAMRGAGGMLEAVSTECLP